MSTKDDSLVSELSDMDLDLELTPLGNDDISVLVNRRFKKQTDKGRAYQIERKKEHCKSIPKRITKVMKTIEGSITDWDNVHEVQNDLEVFSQQQIEFQAAYEAWRDLLTAQPPFTDYAHEWKPPPSDYRNRVTLDNDPLIYLLEKQNRLTEMLSEQHQQNFLPSLSLSSFKGDPTEYHLFIRTFGMRVERNVKLSEVIE